MITGLLETVVELISQLDELNREISNTVNSGTRNLVGAFTGSGVRQGSIAGPTDDQYERFTQLRMRFGEASGALQELIETEIPRIDRRLERVGVPPIGG